MQNTNYSGCMYLACGSIECRPPPITEHFGTWEKCGDVNIHEKLNSDIAAKKLCPKRCTDLGWKRFEGSWDNGKDKGIKGAQNVCRCCRTINY